MGDAMINVMLKENKGRVGSHMSGKMDNEWIKSSFILSDSDDFNGGEYAKFLRKNRYYSTADNKFTCTSPGMSVAVNPKPQYTRYADPRRKGKLDDRPDIKVDTTGYIYGLGQGPYYSEAHDDNSQRVFFRFGVPQYTPLVLWISKSFDVNKAVLQGRGVITSTLLEAVGIVASLFAIATAPILAASMFLFNVIVQSSRFYSVKDTMYIYWATVENILNALVTRRTLVPQVLQDYTNKIDNSMNREQKVSAEFVKNLSSLIPDIIDEETGRISVFAIALRAQAAFNQMLNKDMELNKNYKLSEDFTGYQLNESGDHDTYFSNNKGVPSWFSRNLFQRAYDFLIKDQVEETVTTDGQTLGQNGNFAFNPIYTGPDGAPITLTTDDNNPTGTIDGVIGQNAAAKKDKYDKMKEYAMAELSEGAAFAVFNVDNTGSVGENFSNSTTSNPIEATFNSVAAKARNLGNMLSSAADIPIVGDVMSFVGDAGAMVLSKASFGLANPILALAYGVNVSMPKIWENSSASLPKASYKIKLISPYGNAYSQLFNIYLPLSMILAGSLPRSTGQSSYDSPFVCQMFDRGRVSNQLAIIDNVSLTRGTSNLAFTRGGHANAIDVDISVTSLDEIIAVDVSSNGVLSKGLAALSPNFSDTPFTTYINTLTAVDVYTQVYRLPMLRLKLAERMMAVKAITNPDPAAFGAFIVDKIPFSGVMQTIFGNNTRALDDLIQR